MNANRQPPSPSSWAHLQNIVSTSCVFVDNDEPAGLDTRSLGHLYCARTCSSPRTPATSVRPKKAKSAHGEGRARFAAVRCRRRNCQCDPVPNLPSLQPAPWLNCVLGCHPCKRNLVPRSKAADDRLGADVHAVHTTKYVGTCRWCQAFVLPPRVWSLPPTRPNLLPFFRCGPRVVRVCGNDNTYCT